MADNKKSLLPQGFHDHLSPEASHEMRLNSMLVNNLSLFGYELVRPALMEFEESLDKEFTSDFFKVTDPISGKMMVVRNDITPQIVRIVKDRYGEKALNKIIRLAYTGQVVRKYGSGKFTERQLTQTGYELIAGDDNNRDAEVLYIAIETLNKAGLKDFTVDLCYPKLASIILKSQKLSKKELLAVTKQIEEKDIKSLEKDKRFSDLVKVMKLSDKAYDLKSAVDILGKLKALKISKEVNEIFENVLAIIKKLSSSVDDLSISLNLLEVMNFGYHSGLCYSFISRKTYDEIGRGGRYRISFNDQKINAVGFTFLVNSILRSISVKHDSKQQKIKYSQGFSSSKKLRDKNTVTIFE